MQGKALARPFAISPPALTKHLKVLERACLITRGRVGQPRPCRLDATRLREVENWVAESWRFWEERLGRLYACLQQ